MALNDVLAIARQIADALEAAHEQGIIHRDLKPANIKVRDDGVVKVLDFGLARTLDPGPGTLDAANSPTMTARATQMGMILGTAAYMAPEQAKGRPVDKRADIWAFGVVLHEMLTGRQLFDAEDVSETLAAVLTRDVNVTPLPDTVPARLRALVRECLVRDPKQRLRDIGDARHILDKIIAGTPDDVTAPATVAAAVVPMWRRALPWALVAALLVTLVAVAARDRMSKSAAPDVTRRLQINLPPGVELYRFSGSSISLSPDGLTLAFVGVRDGIRRAFLRHLDQFEITDVPGTEFATSCLFSRDGRELLVGFTDTSLRRIRLSDGLSETIAERTSAYWFAVLPDRRVVFTKDGRLWMSGATPGAAAAPLTEATAGSNALEMQPVLVPGGKAVLFVSALPAEPDRGRIEAISLTDKVRTTVVERASSPLLTSAGDLLFLRDGLLYAAPFDVESLKVTGDASPVLRDLSVVRARGVASGIMAVSDTGVLAYASTAAVPSEIVQVSRNGEEQVLRSTERSVANPRWSPKGNRLVYEEVGNGLWDWDLGRPTPARLADGSPSAQFPIFTRDGRQVIYRTPAGLFRQPLDGGVKPDQIAGSDINEFPSGTTAKDVDVLYTKTELSPSGDMYAVPLAGGKPRVLISTSAYEGGAQVSPDGKWMVYVSNALGGVSEIFVTPYPSLLGRTQVSSGGGIHPIWNPTGGGEIVYRNGDKMISVRISDSPDAPRPTTPTVLFSRRYAFGNGNTIPNFSMTPDGKSFILVKESGVAINVVLNWFETLKRVK